jgi:hypothetical protein
MYKYIPLIFIEVIGVCIIYSKLSYNFEINIFVVLICVY